MSDERVLLAGLELGERADAVRRVEDDVELVDELVALTDERLALVDVVDDGEGHRAVLGLARPADRERRDLLVLIEDVELLLRELVVVDAPARASIEERLDLRAHRIVLLADAVVELERLVERAGAQEEVGAEKRAVADVAASSGRRPGGPRARARRAARRRGGRTPTRARRASCRTRASRDRPSSTPRRPACSSPSRRGGGRSPSTTRSMTCVCSSVSGGSSVDDAELLDRGLVVASATRSVASGGALGGRRRRRRRARLLHRDEALEVAGLVRVRRCRSGPTGARRARSRSRLLK